MILKELLQGMKAYHQAVKIIAKFNLWSYFIIPGIISLFLTLLLIFLGVIYLPDIAGYLNENIVPGFLKGEITVIVTTIFLWIFLLFFNFMVYKYIVLILFSPILSFLSEKVEMLVLRNEQVRFAFKNFISDIFRGLLINIRSIVREIIFTLLCWLLLIIPGIGAFVSVVLIFSIQAYYSGFGLVDYTLERKRLSVKQSIHYSKEHRWDITGIGTGFMVLFMIPIIGWSIAPALGTVAATINVLEKTGSERD